jgi:LysM repeat protein
MTKHPSTTIESSNFETVPGDQLDQATGGYYRPGGGGWYGNSGPGRQPQYYTVQRGDNLTNIAKGAGRSLDYVLSHNPQYQSNPNLIYPGQRVFTGWNYPTYNT